MRRIKRLTIENFQAHKSFSLEPSKGLTAIVGPSDVGKSAIIRAIRWLMLNDPLGDSFITDGRGQCKVSIEFEDGNVITRVKSGSKNYISVNEDTYNNFGRELPAEISGPFGFTLTNLGGNQVFLPIAPQIGTPFLVGFQDQAKAAALDFVSGSDLIRLCVKDLNRDIQSAGQRESMLNKDRLRLEEELAKYPDVEAVKGRMQICDRALEALDRALPKCEALEKVGREIGSLIEAHAKVDWELGSMCLFDARDAWRVVADRVEEIDELQRQADSFGDLLGEARRVDRQLDRVPDVEVEFPDIGDLEKLEAVAEGFERRLEQACRIGREIAENDDRLDGLAEELDELVGDACPLCGVKLTGESREHLLSHGRGSSM